MGYYYDGIIQVTCGEDSHDLSIILGAEPDLLIENDDGVIVLYVFKYHSRKLAFDYNDSEIMKVLKRRDNWRWIELCLDGASWECEVENNFGSAWDNLFDHLCNGKYVRKLTL